MQNSAGAATGKPVTGSCETQYFVENEAKNELGLN